MNKIQLIESISNLNELIRAGLISTSLPANIDIYYHYSNSKSLSKTADEKNVSRKHVWTIVKDFERNII